MKGIEKPRSRMLFKRSREESSPATSQSAADATASPKEDTAASKDSSSARLRLGELLVHAGIVTQEQVQKGLEKQRQSGGFLGQALVDLGFITQETLMSFLVRQCRIPHINLLDYQVSPDILSTIPEEVCLRYGVLPIDRLGKILTVAMVDPLDIDVINHVRAACPDYKVKPILCEWHHFQQVTQKLFKRQETSSDEVSAASLGLSMGIGAKKPSPAEPQAETPVEEEPAAEDQFVSELAEAPEVPPPETQVQDLSETVRHTVKEAVGEQLTSYTQAPVSSDELARTIREVTQETIQQTVSALLSNFKPQISPADPQPAMKMEQLADIMRTSVHDAVREAVSETAALFRAQETAPASAVASSANNLVGFDENRLAELTQAAARAAEAAQAAVEAVLATQRDQAAQILEAARLAQEAAARAEQEAKRAADQAETAVVAENVRKGLQKTANMSKRKAKQAAALLGKAESDALEAIEGPGLKLRLDEKIQAALESELPLPGYRFDTFFVSKQNVFTVQLARAVAEEPGEKYNPFFVYGEVGLGKTHLINAIGNALLEQDESRNVGYVSGSRFARKLMAALEEHALEDFRESYCHWDVLIIDDIQFLGGRIEAQEEFFHIFNALYQGQKQIIIAADNPPDKLGQLEKRLVSRFASGIVACLHPPDWETRLKILRHYAKEASLSIPDDVLTLIATRVSSDVRKMTGSLRKVIAFAELVGQEVTAELVTEILAHLGVEN